MDQIIALVLNFIDTILHLDVHLNEWITLFGPTMYVILFLIIFCETGLVVTPILPGDSLLFALGALTAVDNAYLSYPILMISLIVAAILGDATNYAIGSYLGQKVYKMNSRFIKKEHLEKTQQFYEKYGAKTIVLARFVPIVRTFAPFVAGIGKMNYSRFATYNIFGGVIWVAIFLTAGRVFGNIPAVKQNFHIVIFGIIGVSVLPILLEWNASRKAKLQ
jgi:membrane-associated protein